MKFTLDTNCVIDLDEARPDAPHVRVLVDAHVEGGADVAIVAIMASEKQKGVAAAAETFDEFERRCAGLGLSALPLLLPPVALDLTYLDRCVWASGDQLKLARDIQAVMFPKIEFDFSEFCRARGIDPRGSLLRGLKPHGAMHFVMFALFGATL